MKNVTLVLTAILAFTLSSNASATAFKEHVTVVSKATPPHHGYRMGTYHRSIPRYAVRVVSNGQVFFRYNNVYFRPNRKGYTVVQRPFRNTNNCRPGQGYRNGNRGGQNNRGYNQRGNNKNYRNNQSHPGNRNGRVRSGGNGGSRNGQGTHSGGSRSGSNKNKGGRG